MTPQPLETENAGLSAPLGSSGGGDATLTELVEGLSDPEVQEKRRIWRRAFDEQEQERQSLADQLHERLAQPIIAALLRLQAAEHLQQTEPKGAASELCAVRGLLRECIEEARRIASRLRPPALDEFGIVAAIHHLAAETARDAKLNVEFSHDDGFGRTTSPVETAIFRIVQELLANACRYSQAAKVRVHLARVGGYVQVEVRDWGVGFDPSLARGDCVGLENVRERVNLLGGRTAIHSAPGKGTRVVVRLPLRENFPPES